MPCIAILKMGNRDRLVVEVRDQIEAPQGS
jgi:hypothetical protein